MPILSNPFDAPEAVRARETQEDAWAMYIVVRREAVADQRSLCEATARAVIAAMGARSRPDLAGRYEEWLSGSFRKICLRANEADWRKLAERESIIFFDGPEATSIVAVLPPLRKSDRSGFLRSLQAYNLSAAELPFAACNRAVRAPDAPTLLLAANPELVMSSGKLAAQVGHAAAMAAEATERFEIDANWAAALEAWNQARCPVEMVEATGVGWASALAELECLVVTDSGLTETEPGSRTVLAVRPCTGPELAATRGLLERA